MRNGLHYSNIPSIQTMSRQTRTLEQLRAENEQLGEALRRLTEQQRGRKQTAQPEPQAANGEFERRVQQNSGRLQELQALVASQEEVIGEYKERFREFEDNLSNVMKLDKDIHSRLVNPQSSAALEANVRNVLAALNGKAPYEKLLKMIESIRV